MPPGNDLTGSVDGVELMISVSRQSNDVSSDDDGIPLDEHTTALRERTPVTDFDLSTRNVATNVISDSDHRTTANCYVVSAPGTYRFPLVYGNALVDGETNEGAFRARNGVNGAWIVRPGAGWLGYFKDHLGGDITTPYIVEQHQGKTFTQKLLWMDIPHLIDPDSVHIDPGNPDDPEDDCMTFYIPGNTISQGNAVIALFADGVIAWSWHI